MQQTVCVRKKTKSKIKMKKSGPPRTRNDIHSSPATGTTSRRRAIKHVPRRRPHSADSIDPGVVEIGLVQLSQSVKMTNVTHTRLTPNPNPVRTPVRRVFLSYREKTPSVTPLFRHCRITSREVNEARGGHILAACRVRSNKK